MIRIIKNYARINVTMPVNVKTINVQQQNMVMVKIQKILLMMN